MDDSRKWRGKVMKALDSGSRICGLECFPESKAAFPAATVTETVTQVQDSSVTTDATPQ